ncbi:MAG: secretin N-terminal domain-containing protein, partial [Verrucomicrobiota bacterium]|nr:secretin N-terminal domain-containing protein [Verrucomicrobiota bacterium]
MKTRTTMIIMFGWALALLTGAIAQPAAVPSGAPGGGSDNPNAPAVQKTPAAQPADSTATTGESKPEDAGSDVAKPGSDTTSASSEEKMEVSPPPTHVAADGERSLRLNFRNAPLELVLNYLSEAAGFIIMPGSADVKGKVDVWSNQPLTKEEAVEVLNSVLAKNGYAAVLKGRFLKIVTNSEMKSQYSPVLTGSDPQQIPVTDEVVTQIIPLKFISAVQLSRDLQPLVQTTMAANEGGNSLIITDTQSHIRRIAEIVKALDTAIASVSKVKVAVLKY